jgi:hypothetical protein
MRVQRARIPPAVPAVIEMPDQRSVMKEFRALEQKRLAQGLTPAEERRHGQLRELMGPEAGAAGPRGGFDVNAAAARLRDSLLPAGLRNRPPPTPEVVEPEAVSEVEPEPDPAAAALAAAWEEQPFAPLEADPAAEALFDPSSLGGEGEAPAAGAAWDPSAQPYDPNAQPYDPNAQPYDPSAQPYDPSAPPYDPSAPPYDPSAPPYDPSAPPYDPNAPPYDPNAEPYDPNAEPYEPGVAAGEPSPEAPGWDAPQDGSFDPSSLGEEPPPAPEPETGAWGEAAAESSRSPEDNWSLAEPASIAPEREALSEPEPDFGPAFDATGGGGDWSTLGAGTAPQDGEAWPVDPGAELEDPYAMVPSPELLDVEPTPASMAAAAAARAEGLAAWDAAAPVEEGIGPGDQDEAGAPPLEPTGGVGALPFDAAAASAIDPGQLPEGFEAVPGEFDDNAGYGVTGYEAPPSAHLADDAAGGSAPLWQPESAVDQGFLLESGGSFDAAADAASPGWAGGSVPGTPWAGGDLAEPEPEVELGPPPELDRSAPDLGNDEFFAVSAPPLALGGPASLAPAAARPARPAPPPGLATPSARVAPPKADAEEIPTIDGEEILEAIPEETPPNLDFPGSITGEHPGPGPAGSRAPVEAIPSEDVPLEDAPELVSTVVAGTNRVVIHTMEGLVKRGVLVDADLAAPVLGLAAQRGAEPEVLGADHVKAIFFMLEPGEPPPAAEGKRVRVTFRDGRQVAGFSPDYREGGIGFFMVPADNRTNTGRIWVYRSAVRQVSVS